MSNENWISVHCVGCGQVFMASYSVIEKWSYHCQKCRKSVTPMHTLEEEDEDDDGEEE